MKCKILIRYLIVRGCYQIILPDKTVGLIHAGTRTRFIATDTEGFLMLIYKVLVLNSESEINYGTMLCSKIHLHRAKFAKTSTYYFSLLHGNNS